MAEVEAEAVEAAVQVLKVEAEANQNCRFHIPVYNTGLVHVAKALHKICQANTVMAKNVTLQSLFVSILKEFWFSAVSLQFRITKL